MELFFEVDHCVVRFMTDVHPEQYKPPLTTTIAQSQVQIGFFGFFLAPLRWHVRTVHTLLKWCVASNVLVKLQTVATNH